MEYTLDTFYYYLNLSFPVSDGVVAGPCTGTELARRRSRPLVVVHSLVLLLSFFQAQVEL